MASASGTSEPASLSSQVFVQALTTEVNKQDVINMVEAQTHMLSRFEKTNEMLLNFNQLSASRYETTCQEFNKNTALLTDMKKDLDAIFRRIRVLKTKLSKQYPTAFQACSDVSNVLDSELLEEEEETDNEGGKSETENAPKLLISSPASESGDSMT